MSVLQIIGGMPILYIAIYFYLKPLIPAWSEPDRGFFVFEKEWPKIFLYSGIFATVTGVLLDLFTTASTITAFSVSAVAGLLLIAAYTDMLVGRVPLELSHTTLWTGFGLGLGALIVNGFQVENFQRYYQVIPLMFGGNEIMWIGGGVAAMLAFFMLWRRIRSLVSLVFILLSVLGLWVALTAVSSLIATGLSDWLGYDEAWRNIFIYGIPSMLIVVFFAVAFDLGAGIHMGGADSQSMYAAGWGFAGVVGGIIIGLGVVVASFIQLLLHVFRKPLKLTGKTKTLKRSSLTISLLKFWYTVTGRKGKEISETKTAIALPFLPTLNVSVIGATYIAIILG